MAEQITRYTKRITDARAMKALAKRQAARQARRAGRKLLDDAPPRVTRGWAD